MKPRALARRALIGLLVAASAALAATTTYTFTGVTSDGRTVTAQFTTAAAITSATTLGASAVSCAPACESVGIFPNAGQGYDQLVLDLKVSGGAPVSTPFYFPYGAFAAPGTYHSSGGTASAGTLTVTAAATPQITTASPLPAGVVGVAYGVTFAASGGSGGYGYAAVDAGALPPGLSVSGGALTGTPTAAGTFTFSIRVSDGAGASSTRSFTVQVQSGVTVTTSSLAGATTGLAYSQTLAAAGGTPGYSWSVSAGSLPPGLTLSTGGTLAGIPTVGGIYSFTVRAADSASTPATAQRVLTMSVASQVTITTSSLNYATVGAAYQQVLTAVGGQSPYNWSIAGGNLAPGLTLGTNGVITGTPTTVGNWVVTIRATDSAGNAGTQFFSSVAVTGLTPGSVNVSLVAQAGQPFSYSFTAGGGTPPYSWILASGTMPTGLTLTSSGVLSGTPTTSGTYVMVVRLSDSAAIPAFIQVSLVVAPPITITALPLPNGSVGIAYSQNLAASGGAPPYGWTLASGTLPSGLNLSTGGIISGTPAANGTSNFVVRVTDGLGLSSLQSFNLTVGTGIGITTSPTLPSGTVGAAYSTSFAAVGGSSPYIWTVSAGTIPTGLTLGLDGLLTGTPTVAGTYSFTVRVTDSASATTTLAVSLTIVPVGGTTLSIVTTTLPNAAVGVPYSTTFSATGGTGTLSWSVVFGSLPAGISLSSNGVLSGTASVAGSYLLVVRVQDGAGVIVSQAFTLTVGTQLAITTSSLANGSVGLAYSQTLAAAGGTGNLIWSMAGGTMAPGLGLSTAGIISGTPTTAGIYTMTLQVTDGALNSAQKQLTLTIGATVSITTSTTLPNAPLGTTYSQTLAATGGTAPYYWSQVSGTIPGGLSLSLGGVLSGAATQSGTYQFGIRVTDSTGTSDTKQFTLTVGAAGLTITTTTLANGSLGAAYSQTLTASGGTAPYTWYFVGGSIPPGLSILNGAIVGTPTSAGLYTLVVRVTDATSQSADKQFQMTVTAGLNITTPSTLPQANLGAAYTVTMAASGGTPPYTWSIQAGTFPAGLNLVGATLQGTPTTSGQYSFVLKVTDAAGLTGSQTFTLNVGGSLTFTTTSPLLTGTFGVSYFQALQASGGTAPYSYTVASGSLPAGLTLTSSGLILGTPTLGGEANFVARVTDALGASATQAFKLTILATVTITTPATLPDATVGQTYSQTLTATGGLAPYTWTVLSGTLPAGLNLTTAGVLTGSPSAAGSFPFTARVTDSAGVSSAQLMSLTVGAGSSYSRSGVIAHIASGKDWKTTVTLVNPNSTTAVLHLNFYDDAGQPLTLPVSIVQQTTGPASTLSAIDLLLPANSSVVLETEAAGSTVYTGWIDVRSSATVYGHAIFRQKGEGRPDSEGTSPLESRLPSSVLLPFDNANLFTMGIAVVNPNANAAVAINVIARDEVGQELGRDTLSIAANGHLAYVQVQRMATTNNRRGTLEFQSASGSPLTVLGLRFSPTLSFTSVPAIIKQ